MSWLKAHQPPALMTDLENVRDGVAQWNEFLSTCFAECIADLEASIPPLNGRAGVPQFFDATRAGCCARKDLIEQPIVWNAFPRSLMQPLGRTWALIHADILQVANEAFLTMTLPDPAAVAHRQFFYRQQDEYCEWHLERDAATGNIRRVTFTCEPPEYWTALYGGQVRYGASGKPFTFVGDPHYATELYRKVTGKDVRRQDLALPDGSYNRFNRWNSTHGIVHLAHVSNTIAAEVQLASASTILRRRGDGRIVTSGDELLCCMGFGEPDRNSDPAIGAAANALARLGGKMTLADPVGIYMEDIDVKGWSLPDGIKPADCWRLERGSRGMMERIVVEVPPDTGLTVSDITIGGEPVRFGGQLAECITIKLLGWGHDKPRVRNAAAAGTGIACVTQLAPSVLYALGANTPPPSGMQIAFGHDATAAAATAVRGPTAFSLPPTHATRRRS